MHTYLYIAKGVTQVCSYMNCIMSTNCNSGSIVNSIFSGKMLMFKILITPSGIKIMNKKFNMIFSAILNRVTVEWNTSQFYVLILSRYIMILDCNGNYLWYIVGTAFNLIKRKPKQPLYIYYVPNTFCHLSIVL